MAEDIDKRKLLSALAHGSIFFSALVVSIGIPIVIILITEDEIAKENAKEALNFQLNLLIYGIIFSILTLVLIGWILLGILGLVNLIMPIIGILQVLTNPYKTYKYPFIFRII
ncbi:hypothetical protein PCC7418_2742 [Halothece sp. PCC 7418]|uniref:DUF4870 domain-containing protein n=1 Tax=Halothece sp. (strain PCC 7418) TaxID=65093 RepID=UPI0002A065AD|nr:DUF4870 domain-containing protein [Halothece sp. PCC 7418]AFZ44880.1 hypothetical protein PCC7418_2742 [Halothece sp. PCC 7418]